MPYTTQDALALTQMQTQAYQQGQQIAGGAYVGLGLGPAAMPWNQPMGYGTAGAPYDIGVGARMGAGMLGGAAAVATVGLPTAAMLGVRGLGAFDYFTNPLRLAGHFMRSGAEVSGAAGMPHAGFGAARLLNPFGSGGAAGAGRALAGGLAGGALALGGYYLAAQAIHATAGQAVEGARQRVQIAGGMSQYSDISDPTNARLGFWNPNAVSGVFNQAQGMRRQDPFFQAGDHSTLMQAAPNMAGTNMMNVSNLQQFQTRFKALVENVRNVAMVLGTSLKDALPLVNQLGQMGVVSPREMMRTGLLGAAMGPQFQQGYLGTKAVGAERFRQQGMGQTSGRVAGEQAYTQTYARYKAGLLDDQRLIGLTGQPGPAGVQLLADRTVALNQAAVSSAMGTFTLMGLSNEDYTGLDPRLLQQYRAGALTYQDIQARGRGRGRKNLARFAANRPLLAGELAQDPGASALIYDMAASAAPFGTDRDAAYSLLMQSQTGATPEEVADQLQARKDRPKAEARLRQSASYQAIKARDVLQRQRGGLSGAWRTMVTAPLERTFQMPIQTWGNQFTADVEEVSRSFSDLWIGRQLVPGATPTDITRFAGEAAAGTAGRDSTVSERFLQLGTSARTRAIGQAGLTAELFSDRSYSAAGLAKRTGKGLASQVERLAHGENLRATGDAAGILGVYGIKPTDALTYASTISAAMRGPMGTDYSFLTRLQDAPEEKRTAMMADWLRTKSPLPTRRAIQAITDSGRANGVSAPETDRNIVAIGTGRGGAKEGEITYVPSLFKRNIEGSIQEASSAAAGKSVQELSRDFGRYWREDFKGGASRIIKTLFPYNLFKENAFAPDLAETLLGGGTTAGAVEEYIRTGKPNALTTALSLSRKGESSIGDASISQTDALRSLVTRYSTPEDPVTRAIGGQAGIRQSVADLASARYTASREAMRSAYSPIAYAGEQFMTDKKRSARFAEILGKTPAQLEAGLGSWEGFAGGIANPMFQALQTPAKKQELTKLAAGNVQLTNLLGGLGALDSAATISDRLGIVTDIATRQRYVSTSPFDLDTQGKSFADVLAEVSATMALSTTALQDMIPVLQKIAG